MLSASFSPLENTIFPQETKEHHCGSKHLHSALALASFGGHKSISNLLETEINCNKTPALHCNLHSFQTRLHSCRGSYRQAKREQKKLINLSPKAASESVFALSGIVHSPTHKPEPEPSHNAEGKAPRNFQPVRSVTWMNNH